MVTAHPLSAGQRRLIDATRANLVRIGYQLLEPNYGFSDWFAMTSPPRRVELAAFGQAPKSYETACLAVLPAGEKSGVDLIQDYRALGAPFAFEVLDDRINYWVVGRNKKHTHRLSTFNLSTIESEFNARKLEWAPDIILRAKNVTSQKRPMQKELFDYELVPEIESRINQTLEPRMQNACTAASVACKKESGSGPSDSDLFRLAFWTLAGKVFKDRGIESFQSLTDKSSADDVLAAVASHYGEKLPLLLTSNAREAVREEIWSGFDYRNLSIDVLTRIWTNCFVTKEIREQLGIHPTPRSIAKYIVDHLPIDEIPENHRTIVEPCCGSGTFLLAALQRLRELTPNKTPANRHEYLKRLLFGYEREPIGIEISRLSLTLADFPNPNGWQLAHEDVFASNGLQHGIASARVVLCNPPFEDFDKKERLRYELRSLHKPVELLLRILKVLRPDAMLGFVLPRSFLNGKGYSSVRRLIAERYSTIDVLSLPDNAFGTSDLETSLLIAHTPRVRASSRVHVDYSRVREHDWEQFKITYSPSEKTGETKSIDDAEKRLLVLPIPPLWQRLSDLPTLGEIAKLQRGFEWEGMPLRVKGVETGNRKILIKYRDNKQLPHYRMGIPPQADGWFPFEIPETAWLCMNPKYERGNSYEKDWDAPKVILPKTAKHRGKWRIAAFADYDGLTFYQTYIGIWPTDGSLTTCIAAVLNSPISNAMVFGIEGKVDITTDTLSQIPIPIFSDENRERIESLVVAYKEAVRIEPFKKLIDEPLADKLLREIDAEVLAAYELPPKTERQLLDYFNNEDRVTRVPFANYYPSDFTPSFPLRDWLTGRHAAATVESFLQLSRDIPSHIADALATAANVEN